MTATPSATALLQLPVQQGDIELLQLPVQHGDITLLQLPVRQGDITLLQLPVPHPHAHARTLLCKIMRAVIFMNSESPKINVCENQPVATHVYIRVIYCQVLCDVIHGRWSKSTLPPHKTTPTRMEPGPTSW